MRHVLYAVSLLTSLSVPSHLYAEEIGSSSIDIKETTVLKTARRKAQAALLEKYAKDDSRHSFWENRLQALPLVPEEKSIVDFPAPIDSATTNPSDLAQYYKNVAEAYRQESNKALASQTHALANKATVKEFSQLEGWRSENLDVDASGRRIIRNKEYLQPFPSETVTPSKTQKHFGTAADRAALAASRERFRVKKENQENLELKADFYNALSEALTADEVTNARQPETQ